MPLKRLLIACCYILELDYFMVWSKRDRPACDDPASRHLGRGGPTNPPQKEQCRKTVYTVQMHWARGAKTRSPYYQ